MAEVFYPARPATDSTLAPVVGGVFQVFELSDTTYSAPLQLRVGDGNPKTTVEAGALGTVPGTYVTSDNYSHNWKSGEFVWRRDSTEGIRKAVEDARIAAVEVQTRAANGEFKGGKGDKGDPGKDGSNVLPTSEAIQQELTSGPSADLLSATFASRVGRNVAAPTDAPSFVKQGVQLTHSNSGLPSIYWPYVVNVEHIAGAAGKFYMYYSTDHDLGAGGIRMAYANSPTGPWPKHPTMAYADTVAGDQTETPTVIWNDATNLFHMYYQQEGTGLNQSTFLATSPDGITWTRVGMVLQGVPNLPGDGQTTYARVFRFNGQWVAYHLLGGGNYGHGGISYSHDGINWVTDPRRFGFFNDFIGDTEQRIDLFHAAPFVWRGELWAITQLSPHVGGFVEGGLKWVLGKLTPDMRGWRGTPRQILATLPAGETEATGPINVIAYGNKLYTYYRANGAYGNFSVAVAEA